MDPRRITCAVCRKPVQRTEWWDDYSSSDRVLRVYCHGATQEMRLDMMRVAHDTLRALETAQGVAFDVGAIAGPNAELRGASQLAGAASRSNAELGEGD